MEFFYVLMPIAGVKIFWPGLIILGVGVGIIGGFFGMGGAWMVTPGLNILGFPMAFAIGTDIAHMAGKSLISTMRHGKFGNVDYKLGLIMLFGTAILVLLSAWSAVASTNIEFQVVFFLYGFGFFASEVGNMSLGLEICRMENRASYLAIGSLINLPGMLHIRPVLSPYAHARISSIDVSAASPTPKALTTGKSARLISRAPVGARRPKSAAGRVPDPPRRRSSRTRPANGPIDRPARRGCYGGTDPRPRCGPRVCSRW